MLCFNKNKFSKIYEKNNMIIKTKFSKIYICTDKETKKNYIVKMQNPLTNKNNIRNEIKILKYINNLDNICKVLHTEINLCSSYIVFNKFDGITLLSYLNNNNPNISDKINIIKQLLKGFTFIQNKNIIHRDIKSDNIMINYSNNIEIKIIDFGLSIYQKYLLNFCHNEPCGIYSHMCPEMLSGIYYNASCDTWSLGVVIYYLLMNDYPYKLNMKNIINYYNFHIDPNKIINTINFNIIKNIELQNLLKKMLIVERNDRQLINQLKM